MKTRTLSSIVPMLQALEGRRLLAVLPAFADQIGLNANNLNLNPTFSDDFNGTSLDSTKWQIREGARWRPTPSSDEFTWTHRDAVRVRNGTLEMIAHNDPATGQFRSGWIQTGDNYAQGLAPPGGESKLIPGYTGDFEQRYGYWEARLKFNSLPGQWSAFWVHSYKMVEVMNDPSRANRPDIYGTEYDVAEHASTRNGNPWVSNEVSAVVHANGYESFHTVTANHTNTTTLAPSYSSPSEWHVYGLLWTPTSVSYYLDGNLVKRDTDPNLISKVPHVGILSMEIGAPNSLFKNTGRNYFGVPPTQGYGTVDTSQAKLTADYFRVWQLNGEPTPPTTPTNPTTPTPVAPIVQGTVFNDANGNGIRDANETGRANVRVYLDLNYSATRDANEPQTTTDANGAYRFTNVPVTNALAIRQDLSGTTLTQTTPTANASLWITTQSNQTHTLNPFGVRDAAPTTPPPASGTTVTGHVFTDNNANGRQDANEAVRAGVSVYLDLNMNGVRDASEPATTTDNTGVYRFNSVRSGALAVRLALSGTGVSQTFPLNNNAHWVAVGSAGTQVLSGFGVSAGGAPPTTPSTPSPHLPIIIGTVFNDTNANGRRDTSEAGVANVRVYIDYNMNGRRDSDEPTTLTTATGGYRFDHVRVASAMAVRLDLSTTAFLRQTAPTNNNAVWLATASGNTYNDQNFGVVGQTASGSLANTASGSIYLDSNRNGWRDAGENGVAGLIVWLDTNMNGIRDSFESFVTTTANGSFSFSNLSAAAAMVFRVDLRNTGYSQITPTSNNGQWRSLSAGGSLSGLDFGVSWR